MLLKTFTKVIAGQDHPWQGGLVHGTNRPHDRSPGLVRGQVLDDAVIRVELKAS